MLLQQLINGLSIGSIYALMAVGYSIVYSILNFTNFAHGLTVTIGAFTAFYILSYVSANLFLSVLIGILAGALLAMLIESAGYRPLLKKNANRLYLLIAGLGITTMCENLIIIIFTSRFHAYPINITHLSVNILNISVGLIDVAIFIVSMLALIFVSIFIKKTRSGLAIRSASFDLDTTSLMGVNVQKLILTVFIIAGGLAGLAGGLLGAKYTAFPMLGSQITIKAFISSVFGGLGSIPGAVLGAVILGVGETLISAYVSSSLRDIFSFSLLVIILFIRPEGLMGKSSEDKA